MPTRAPTGEGSCLPMVSVIICTYRRPNLLPRAIRSVLEQTFRDLELIVVDDASGDETAQVIADISDPRLVHVENEVNLGLPASRNRGLEQCRGAYVAFLDDDDEWRQDKLDLQVRAMKSSSSKVAAIWAHAAWVRADGSTSPRRIRLDGDVHRRLQRHDIVMMQPLLVRRSVFEAVGQFDPNTSAFEDYEFSLRLSRQFHFRTVDEELVLMHNTPGSLSQNHQRSADVIGYLLDKPGLLTDRNARGRWWVRAAGHYAALGDQNQWRWALREASKADPFSVRAPAALAIGRVAGPTAIVRAARARNRLGRLCRGLSSAVRSRISRSA